MRYAVLGIKPAKSKGEVKSKHAFKLRSTVMGPVGTSQSARRGSTKIDKSQSGTASKNENTKGRKQNRLGRPPWLEEIEQLKNQNARLESNMETAEAEHWGSG